MFLREQLLGFWDISEISRAFRRCWILEVQMLDLCHDIPLYRWHKKVYRKDSLVSSGMDSFLGFGVSVGFGVLGTRPVCGSEPKSCEEQCPPGLSGV